jgi:hypothetical protein
LVHLLTTVAKLLGPGGAKAIIAENLLLKQQPLVVTRSQRRAPNLSTADRFIMGLWSLFLRLARITKTALSIRPSTLLNFHQCLVQRKYRRLFSPNLFRCESIRLKSHWVHPFVERLIGTVRREFLDKTLFWNAVDLHKKLEAFQLYYNHNRFHASLEGGTPAQVSSESKIRQADLDCYRWESHCRGLVQLPVA